MLLKTLNYYWDEEHLNQSIKVFLALASLISIAMFYHLPAAITPMSLGVIAAGVAEVDTQLWRRLKALGLMLISFLFVSFSIEILFPYPALFALGLFLATIALTLIGALSSYYQSITFASLMLAVYTMLVKEHSSNTCEIPLLLVSGAVWYGLLSLGWQLIWPYRPVQQALANVYNALAHYFEGKSSLFYPDATLNAQPLRLQAAKQNTIVVTALNKAPTILSQWGRGRSPKRSRQYLHLYSVAQDIHERVSASHYRYQELATVFARSDALFRVEKVLHLQAQACRQIADTLFTKASYQHSAEHQIALQALEDAITHLHQQNTPKWYGLLIQLDYLLKNLTTINRLIASAFNETLIQKEEAELAQEPKGLMVYIYRVIAELHYESRLLHHGIRLGAALVIGYGIICWQPFPAGFWVLLTTLFVCQPSYSATREKLKQRVLGTIFGLLVGIPLLYFFPSFNGQLVLITLFGTLFFTFRMARYDLATLVITLFVLMCSDIDGDAAGTGFEVILPRLVDTLIGCALAVAAVFFILPDWESKRVNRVMAKTINCHRAYLKAIVVQYQYGKHDNLKYRLARRHAHNMDAELHTAILNMQLEPSRLQLRKDDSFRFLNLSHALLNYISTLGSHRVKLHDMEAATQLFQEYQVMDSVLAMIEQQLLGKQKAVQDTNSAEFAQCAHYDANSSDECRNFMLHQQLQLIIKLLPEMQQLAVSLHQQQIKG